MFRAYSFLRHSMRVVALFGVSFVLCLGLSGTSYGMDTEDRETLERDILYASNTVLNNLAHIEGYRVAPDYTHFSVSNENYVLVIPGALVLGYLMFKTGGTLGFAGGGVQGSAASGKTLMSLSGRSIVAGLSSLFSHGFNIAGNAWTAGLGAFAAGMGYANTGASSGLVSTALAVKMAFLSVGLTVLDGIGMGLLQSSIVI